MTWWLIVKTKHLLLVTLDGATVMESTPTDGINYASLTPNAFSYTNIMGILRFYLKAF